MRVLSNPIEVNGYLIPKGTHVMSSNYVLGHDPRNYADPEKLGLDQTEIFAGEIYP